MLIASSLLYCSGGNSHQGGDGEAGSSESEGGGSSEGGDGSSEEESSETDLSGGSVQAGLHALHFAVQSGDLDQVVLLKQQRPLTDKESSLYWRIALYHLLVTISQLELSMDANGTFSLAG